MAYTGFVVKVEHLRKHSNADRLQIATFFGNDTIVSLDTKIGDIGVYFPVDGQLSERFCAVNDLVRRKDENGNLVTTFQKGPIFAQIVLADEINEPGEADRSTSQRNLDP